MESIDRLSPRTTTVLPSPTASRVKNPEHKKNKDSKKRGNNELPHAQDESRVIDEYV